MFAVPMASDCRGYHRRDVFTNDPASRHCPARGPLRPRRRHYRRRAVATHLGVVPTRADGSVAGDVAEQARTVWQNIAAVLTEAGMAPRDIVSVTTYVVPGQDLAAVMAARDRFLDGHLAASTLVIVPELARPAWKVEIAIVAAR